MVDIHTVSMMTGYAVASYVGLGFYFVGGKNGWRGPMGLSAAWPCIALCASYWVPESPRYLVLRGCNTEALNILVRTHADPQNDPTNEHARHELHLIEHQIELDNTSASKQRSYKMIFKQASLRRRVWMTILLEFALMSSGILVILSKSPLNVYRRGKTSWKQRKLTKCCRQRRNHLGWSRFRNLPNPQFSSRFPAMRISFQSDSYDFRRPCQTYMVDFLRDAGLCSDYDD